MVVNSTGTTLYVAAFGSSKVGVLPTPRPSSPTRFDPTSDSANYLTVTGGGPGGLALDETRNRLYVLTRFDNAVKVVNLATKAEIQGVAAPQPGADRPWSQGRPFLYDAANTSSNGEASCSSCHVFGDFDTLAWDLGNPDDVVTTSPMQVNLALGPVPPPPSALNGSGARRRLPPDEGPDDDADPARHGEQRRHALARRSLERLLRRGRDRRERQRGPLVPQLHRGVPRPGRPRRPISRLRHAEVRRLRSSRCSCRRTRCGGSTTCFAATRTTRTRSTRRAAPSSYLGTRRSDGLANDIFGITAGFTCNGCHTLDASQGFFGTGGCASFENETQILKIAHLRNLYQKVGMFGMPKVDFFRRRRQRLHKGDQVRGFGFLHDGSVDTVFRFLSATVFSSNGPGGSAVGFDGPNSGNNKRRSMEQYILAFDTDIAAIVGQQATLTSATSATVGPRVDVINDQADDAFTSKVLGGAVREGDVVAKGVVGGVEKGWYRSEVSGPDFTGANYLPDDGGPAVTLASLKALATTAGNAVTFTAVTPGAGRRVGVDRDLDGDLNAQDNCPAVENASQTNLDGDAAGDACDNCAAKSNGDQSDVDADGTGDTCDNACGYGTTTLASLSQGTASPTLFVTATGSGFGPGAQVRVGGVAATAVTNLAPSSLSFQVPTGLTTGQSYGVEVVNPEGCRSQEVVNLTIGNPPSSCGLTGFEAFALLGLVAGARRLRRRLAA